MSRVILMATVLALFPLHLSTAWAVRPQTWTQTSQEDFLEGRGENVAVSSLGELTLTRPHQELLAAKDDVQVVYALAETADGSLYAATGPKGILYRIAPDGKVTTVFTRDEDPLLLCLLPLADGRLLIGTGGKEARILALTPDGKVSVLGAPNATNHVWALAADKAGNVYAATGPNGQLFKLAPNGQLTKIFTADQPNLISLAVTEDGTAYAGTDRDGMIYRVTKEAKPFVVYNASEAEIVALALDAKGRLLAAASGTESELDREPTSAPILHKSHKAAKASPQQSGEEESTPAGEVAESTEPTGPSASQPLQGAGLHEEKSRSLGKASESGKKGPTVFLIDPAGYVNELHRFDRPLQSLTAVGSEIWVGAGSDGWVNVLRPDKDEMLAYSQLPAEQVTALLVRKSGAIAVATANSGQVFEYAPALAKEGTFTSKGLDAEQVVAFGTVDFDVLAPDGASVTVATRSGNMAEPDDELWSAWTGAQPSGQKAGSPAARFLQYRLTLKANPKGEAPTLTEIRTVYQSANRHPLVAEFKTGEDEENGDSMPEGKRMGSHKETAKVAPAKPKELELSWKGTDPNNDELIYTLSFRLVGTTAWVPLKDRLTEAKFTWDISAVPDGRYELRIIASDAPDNAPGTELTYTLTSRPVTVCNTAPVVTIEPVKVEGRDLRVTAKVKGQLSRIVSVQFAVDAQDNWRAASASSGIFDSPTETAEFKLSNLASGPHYLAVRAADAVGNVGFATLEIKVP